MRVVRVRSKRWFVLTVAGVLGVCVLLAAGVALMARPSEIDNLQRELSAKIVSGTPKEDVVALLSVRGVVYYEYDDPPRIQAIVHDEGGFLVKKSLSISVQFRAGRASDIRIETLYTGP